MKKIAIIGNGVGGLITSSKLAKDLAKEIKSGEVSIMLFDKKTEQEFQPGNLDVAFRGTDPSKMRRPVEKLVYDGVKIIHDNCEKVDLPNRYLKTEGNDEKIDFDYIIISTGSSPDYDQIPGLRDANMDFHTNAYTSSLIYQKILKIKSAGLCGGVRKR